MLLRRSTAPFASEATKRAKEAEGKPKEADWMLEDPDLEKLRQERLAALRSKSTQVKQHREAGHGELREIVEEEFLKEVTSTKVRWR